MPLDPDIIIDRRRLRRTVAFWRTLAIVVLVAVIALFAGLSLGDGLPLGARQHIARLPIGGTILNDRDRLKLIERLAKNDSVRAVVVAIDSPGGTTVGGETLYHALRDLAAVKPVVAQIGTMGTSAAYLAAIAADHVVAHETSITGSIGVLVQYGEIDRLLDDLGIEIGKVESGPLKAEPSPFEPVTPAAIAQLQSIVDDSFQWFRAIVGERRALDEPHLDAVTDGRIFTGRQALGAGLVDELGGEEAAIAWLAGQRQINPRLPVRTWESDGSSLPFGARLTDRAVDRALARLGVDSLGGLDHAPVLLDGLVSLWQAHLPRADAQR